MVLLKWLALFLLLLTVPSFGRGGYNTTFDPNSEGGGWACFRSAASGTCGGATAHFSNAACDGVTDDTTALLDWISYGIGLGATRAKLYIPPGSNCFISSASCLTTTCTAGDLGIQNALVWGYGATFNNLQFGGLTFFQDNLHNAYIQSANIGDTCVTLLTAGDASIFTNGAAVLISGLSVQKGGDPPNFAYYEQHVITSISGTTTKVICFDGSLINQYLSTWPQIDDKHTGGPAAIYLMQPSWNARLEVHGLTVTNPNQINIEGRTTILYDLSIPSAGPTSLNSVWFFGGRIVSVEWDKNITFAEMFRTVGGSPSFQSGSPRNLILDSTHWSSSFNGTAQNATIINSSTATELRVAPNAFGQGQNLTVIGSTYPLASSSNRNIALAAMTYDGAGTLSIPHVSGSINSAWADFIPGATYYLGASDGSDVSTPHTTFVSTAVTDDGTNLKLSITCQQNCASMPAALPTATCSGLACSTFAIYSLTSATQQFTGASPNLLGFVAH